MAHEELLHLARTIAVEAGELAAGRRAAGVEVADRKSSITDVVTAADREVELLVRERLAAARPDDGICGEEGEDQEGASGLTWVVDPIDGTVNYLYGIPNYAVSIAVVEGDANPKTWRALAGAVFAPGINELYTASAGGGAFLNDQRLVAGPDTTLAESLLGTGFAYDPDRRSRQAAVVQRLISKVRDIRRLGVTSMDLSFVAAGRLNAFYEPGLWPWDFAAGALIASEAGAWVGDLDGGQPGRDVVLACHRSVREAFLEALEECGAREVFGPR
ncbi:inositol monophosphatase family protein [Enemella sp. A6]|uniref:inositol monophosphatase family protein n=1 Tax=Enemella sp. A6 TaxID=3440152 RepID=UPI003EBB19C8